KRRAESAGHVRARAELAFVRGQLIGGEDRVVLRRAAACRVPHVPTIWRECGTNRHLPGWLANQLHTRAAVHMIQEQLWTAGHRARDRDVTAVRRPLGR